MHETVITPEQQITNVIRRLVAHRNARSTPGRMRMIKVDIEELAVLWPRYLDGTLKPMTVVTREE